DNHGVSGLQDDIKRAGKHKSIFVEDGIVSSMVSRSSKVVTNFKILVATLRFLVSKGFGLPCLLDLYQRVFGIKGILLETSRISSCCG
ncbi:hypothetical protein AMTR_s00082p00103730, partial [Amborella trichopoda]